MKTYKFFEVLRQARLAKQFAVMETSRNWPLCLTCGREVESVNLEHENDHSVEIRVRCHGAEDACRIEFPMRMDGSIEADGKKAWAIKRVMQDFCPFDPSHREK